MKLKLLNLRSFILVIITGLMLSSCTKDSTPADDLIGTWNTESATFSIMVGNQTLADYLVDELGLTAAEAQQLINLFNAEMQQSYTGTILMKSDNTYTATLGGEADSGTWSLSSDNKKLTIDSDTEEPMILDIIELTSSRLHLQGTETVNEDLNGDDVPEAMAITIDLTFTK